MIALQAAAEPTPFWLTVAIGLGVGSLVGSVAVAATSLVGQWRQRIFDRNVRRDDRAHALALKQFDDKQRLRDRRLDRLEAGLTEIVEALVALTEAVGWLRFKGARKEEANRAKAEAAKHFDLARPRLVLDPAGREVMEAFRKVQTEIIVWENTDDRLEWAKMDPKIVKMLSDAVDRAQQIMEQTAQPVTV